MASHSRGVAQGVGPVLLAVIAAGGVGLGGAQERPASAARPPAFEVASVKPAGPPVPGVPIGPAGGPGKDPGRFSYNNARLNDLLSYAYSVQLDQIIGPDWIGSAEYTYTVAATMDPKTTEAEFRVMLQNLLAERFQVRLHHETRNRPGYELTVAKGGVKMKEWTPPKEADATPESTRTGPLKWTLPRPGRPATAELRASMAQFSAFLPILILNSTGEYAPANRPRVVDQTGLTGTYEFAIRYATGNPSAAPSALPEPGTTAASTPQEAPDLFSVLEDQLGLKLRSAKNIAVDVLVIDDASKAPTAN